MVGGKKGDRIKLSQDRESLEEEKGKRSARLRMCHQSGKRDRWGGLEEKKLTLKRNPVVRLRKKI